MAELIVICILIFHLSTVCAVNKEPKPEDRKDKSIINTPKQPNIPVVNITPKLVIQNLSTKATTTPNIKNNANSDIESGAVMRGIFVFVGITLLVLTYLVFKTYRRTTKKNAIVTKYGIRTRKTDTEMEPLPLDDDEEDETVFELKNVNNR